MKSLSEMRPVPWDRHDWRGKFVSLDESPADDFTVADVEEIVAYGETAPGWDGANAGIVRLKDGRYVGWEADWGPTGDGFCHDAYGGTADIIVARSVDLIARYMSEASRELLDSTDAD